MAIRLIDYVNQSDDPMRQGLIQAITNESVFLKTLNFVQVDGFTYTYSTQKTLGSVAFRGLNETFTDDVGVINPATESLAIFGGTVRTDRQIVNKPSGPRIRANAIAAKVKKSGLFYDKYVIQGDPATNGKQFYGLNARLTGNQVIAAGTNGAALALSMLDQLIDSVVGTNDQKRLAMRKSDRRTLTGLVVAAAGGAAVLDVGRQATQYDGVTIDILDEDGDESPILTKTETQGSSSLTSSIYCYRPGSDTDGEYMQGLINENVIDHVDYGERLGVYDDLIESLMGLGLFHSRAAARLKGIL